MLFQVFKFVEGLSTVANKAPKFLGQKSPRVTRLGELRYFCCSFVGEGRCIAVDKGFDIVVVFLMVLQSLASRSNRHLTLTAV